MTMTVDFVEPGLAALLDRTPAGEEIILAEAGKPYARVVKLAVAFPRRPGGWPELAPLADDAMKSAMTDEDIDAWEAKLLAI